MKNLTQTPSQLYNINQLDQFLIGQGAEESDLDRLFRGLDLFDGFYNALEVDKILLEDQGQEFVRIVQSRVARSITLDC